MKPVKISHHAGEQAFRRGADLRHVVDAVTNGSWEDAERGRLKTKKTFPYGQVSSINGTFYRFQTIEVIFVEEPTQIIVVTVKVYYSNQEMPS